MVQIVKTFKTIPDAWDYIKKIEKCGSVLSEPILYISHKYKGKKKNMSVKVVFNVK